MQYSKRFAHGTSKSHILKTSIEGLGANKAVNTICHLGKALGVFAPVLSNFDKQNYVANVPGVHKPPSVGKGYKGSCPRAVISV